MRGLVTIFRRNTQHFALLWEDIQDCDINKDLNSALLEGFRQDWNVFLPKRPWALYRAEIQNTYSSCFRDTLLYGR